MIAVSAIILLNLTGDDAARLEAKLEAYIGRQVLWIDTNHASRVLQSRPSLTWSTKYGMHQTLL